MNNSITIAVFFLIFSYVAFSEPSENDPFKDAKWIAYEQLDDSMKVVPAVHGNGDNLGDKCLQRSVVPLFRKTFRLSGKVKWAKIDICGLGHYLLFVNGDKIGDRFLSPGWTLYQKRCLYNTFDLTDQVKAGENAIGVIVGNGFFNVNRERYRKLTGAYGYPRLIYSVTVVMEDGTVKRIDSDPTTKVHTSPITFSSIYGGEDYDATLEQQDWNRAEFDDSAWSNSIELRDSIGKLYPENDHPLRVMEVFQPKKVLTSKTRRTVYDFGQNASGIIQLKVKGNRGAKVVIRPSELLDDKGNVTQRSGGGPYILSYTLKGDGVEEWQPHFTYYGFRYADVAIIEPKRAKENTETVGINMLHTRNSAPVVGSFACSESLFNEIFDLINWGIKSNMASVATDCPHREKLGWLEQTYLIGSSMHFNFDIHTFYSKIVDDMIDSQLDNGLVPDIAPEYVHFNGGFRDSPEWGSASVIIPWLLYKWYGDQQVLRKAYSMMKRYVEYLKSKSTNNLLNHGLGDWYDLGPRFPGEAQLTPKAVTATAIYYYDLLLLTEISEILGEKEDQEKFKELSSSVRNAFLNAYYNSEKGVVSTGSQTAYAMSLYTGLIPKKERDKVFQNLVDSIHNNNYALTSGDIGYHFLVQVLSKNGRSDVLYQMNNRTDVPGYGYQLKKGATALTESWAALPQASNNHMMLGHLMEWFYTGLGGINQKPNSVGYDSITIAPKPVGDIKWVKCSYNSVKGLIVSNWELQKDAFQLQVEIPNGVHSTIVIPEEYLKDSCIYKDVVSGESTKPVLQNGMFDIGPGKYQIVTR